MSSASAPTAAENSELRSAAGSPSACIDRELLAVNNRRQLGAQRACTPRPADSTRRGRTRFMPGDLIHEEQDLVRSVARAFVPDKPDNGERLPEPAAFFSHSLEQVASPAALASVPAHRPPGHTSGLTESCTPQSGQLRARSGPRGRPAPCSHRWHSCLARQWRLACPRYRAPAERGQQQRIEHAATSGAMPPSANPSCRSGGSLRGRNRLGASGVTDCPVTAIAVTRRDGRDNTDVRYPPFWALMLMRLTI
jgi:hypothetical protein